MILDRCFVTGLSNSKFMDTILLLSHSGDYYTIDNVQKHLKQMGYRAVRIDTDMYPSQLSVDFYRETETGIKKVITVEGEDIDASDIKGIWLRRIWSPKLPDDLDPEYRAYCANESSTHFNNYLDTLDKTCWMDNPSDVYKAQNKLYQMEEAVKENILMPETLVSNNPERITRFFNKVNGNMIAKMQTVLSVSMSGNGPEFRTSKIEESDIEGLDSVRYSPMIFQEEITKKAEYRVIYVDGKFYCGRIDNDTVASDSPDIKSNRSVEWNNGTLPADLQAKICRMMSNMNLSFGAIDIVETNDGEFVYLEVNPVGEWGMLEMYLDLPISKAIAETIDRKIKDRSLQTE
jgi:glutathione synthase/RimK-type ligase-like ATP-grasp enzyme